MTIEDEMSIHFQNVKYVTDENEALHYMIEENRQKLQEQQSQLQEQQSQLQEKDSQLQEKDSQLQEQQSQLASSIQMLSELGISPEQIANKLKVPIETVQLLLCGKIS